MARIVIVVVLLAVVGCRASSDVNDDLRELQSATCPPGASLKVTEPAAHSGWGMTERWEVTYDLAWDTYIGSAGNRLTGYTRIASEKQGHAEFRRSRGGDTTYLSVDVVDAGPPLHTSIRFMAMAD